MTTPERATGERVLVLMPTAQDAERTRALLLEAGIPATTCADVEALCREIAAGAGAILLTDEAFSGDREARLAAVLAEQPPWSDLPFVVFTRDGADGRHAALRESLNATLVERPVRMRTLLSVVRAALRSRRHQYEARDLIAQLTKAENAVRASEERHRALVTSSSDVVYRMSPDWAELLPLDGRNLVAGNAQPIRNWLEKNLPAYEHARVREAIAEALSGRQTFEMEHRVIRPDGSIGWTFSRAVPIVDPTGAIVEWFGTARDITERKEAEEAIRVRDERLQLLLGHATDYAVIISDPEDRVLEWLGGAEAITGWRLDEVLGKRLEIIFTPEDRAAGVALAETSKAAETRQAETRQAENVRWHQRKDGTRFFAEGVTVAIRGPDGQLRGFGKVFRDATARKLAEETLTRDAMLLANVHDAVIMTDMNGLVTYWNQGAARLFGWTPEEMVGRHYADRFDEPVRTWVAEEIRKRAAGSEWSGEYEDFRKDGSRVWIDARVTHICDAAGAVVGVLGVSHDISERKRAEDALKDIDRKKDDFIALLAHELRNPLAPIRNGLQVLRLSPERGARERAQQMMDRQLTHMVRLIDDLLDVSRIGRNKMELRVARILLADAISSAVETARPAIEAAGHVLLVDLPPDPIFLDADLTRLAQVFSNLLTNSAKYTEEGGRITLVARPDGEDVVVSVTDTGIGIPVESLPQIFDMFSQVDRSIERSTGGLGIGLALVKGLVEMHGGTVTAASSGLGLGSEFTVRLPVAVMRLEGSGEPSTSLKGTTWGPGRRILVVDDNRDSAESMGQMLRLFGNEVALAHDGEEAVERAGEFRPQVILMDVGMPRLNGYEATNRIRQQPWGKEIAIVALTGWGQEGDRTRSKEAGCDAHLVKPVSLPDLQSLLMGLA
jgi:PAS domain S-box-containing protein